MKVDIYRKVETSESITGEFWLDGLIECYYLEPSRFTPYHSGASVHSGRESSALY
jgi:hypothetical protein